MTDMKFANSLAKLLTAYVDAIYAGDKDVEMMLEKKAREVYVDHMIAVYKVDYPNLSPSEEREFKMLFNEDLDMLLEAYKQ